jgi:hypothetical protein
MLEIETNILDLIKLKDETYWKSLNNYYILKEDYVGTDSDNERKLGITYYILYDKNEQDKLYYTWKNHLTSYLFEPNEYEPEHKYKDKYLELLNELYTELSSASGGKRTAAPVYKLNGEKVSLLINKKKLHRSVYVKGNGKAKYCKINYEFVLLSKLKNKVIH